MVEKTALVLSAGGMFGAYQAGVWEALAGRFRPDVVVGVSVGALNGWAIAGGCTPEELTARWLDPRCAALARPRWAAPWRGLLDGAALHEEIQRLYAEFEPCCSVGVVATELARLRPRLFRDGEIRWRCLAASCAAPFCYPPVRVDGRLYADGGILSPAPVWAAVAMGAQRVVLVHLLPKPVSRLLRLAVRIVRALASQPPRGLCSAAIVTIAPSEPLGRLRDSLFWDAANVERWIRAGRHDAQQALEVLERLS